MVKCLIIFLAIIFQIQIIPQENDSIPEINESEYLFYAGEMPVPVDGTEGISSRAAYTKDALNAGVEGKVYVKAFINEEGKVTKVKLIKGLGFGLDQSALYAVYNTKFKPGKTKGKPIKVFILIPIQFSLD